MEYLILFGIIAVGSVGQNISARTFILSVISTNEKAEKSPNLTGFNILLMQKYSKQQHLMMFLRH